MKILLVGAALALAAPSLAAAQSAVEGVTVTARDPAGLLERQPSDAVFGLAKPLLETPRSASFVSAATLDRYGVRALDDLVAVSPGTFTDSYYGVPGSLNLRGTLAENYFRGFKRVENRGTYPTPLPAAEQVEIVRGPPTPAFGPGKVGGLMNFVPRTARIDNHFVSEPTGEAEATVGAYGLKRLSGQIGAPLRLGWAAGGLYVYAEAEDGGSYYRGIDPRHQLAEISGELELHHGWSVAFGAMAYRARGYVQTPGWNRLTQALIDRGVYTTGRDSTLVDKDGNGRLTPNEVGPGGLMPYFSYAEASALEVNQSGGVAPSLVSSDAWLSGSRLAEAGVKARLWGDVLTGSLAVYRQARTQLSLNNAVQGTRARGVELELRWLASERLSFTFAGDIQTTRIKGPDNSFIVVPPATVGISGVNGYGGAYALYTVSTLVKGDYTQTLIPHSVASLFAVYTGPRRDWGRVGATVGVTAVASTQGFVPGAVRLPAYAVASASAYLQSGPWRLGLNVDNLLDRRYFTPVADVYANVAALPGVGRTWRVALRRAF